MRGAGAKDGRESGTGESRRGRPGRPRRRPLLKVEEITATAIRIADAEGLEAVSIRRIAAELDERPMSLYDHIADKDELLAMMGDEITGEIVVPGALPDGWREALMLIARRLYAALITHPWYVLVARQQYRRLGPNARRQASTLAAAVSGLDLEATEMWTVIGTMNDYVVGHGYRQVTGPPPSGEDEVIPKGALSDAPELAALPDYLRTMAAVERFERGLEIVLDGIEVRHGGR
jgi:AcrR family transcriptional regulator